MPLAENDTVTTIGEGGARVRLYPLRVVGRFVRARTLVAWTLTALLLIAPWIDVGGHPAMFFDIPHRRFYFWGLTLMATDGNYLLFLAGLVVFGVFFFTALFGRVWCGWACPQTVFMESFVRPIEELIEGKPSARKKLDAAPWTAEKILKKGAKLGAFLVLAGAIATTFTAYFLGRDGVIEAQTDPLSHPVGTGTFVLLTGLLFFDFAWFREQTCVVVCPYGRFQSVLMDEQSLAVVYDERRGEPRGKPGRAGVGDCVDCRRCVQVCPTGIDIRKGVQMECVNCAACIDACDGIMDKLGRPRGLIRYGSEATLAGRPRRLLRPRVLAYGLGLVATVGLFGVSVARRAPVEVHLTRQVGPPFHRLPDGRIQNATSLRLSNRDGHERRFTVVPVAPPDLEIVGPRGPVAVPAGAVEHVPLSLVRPDPLEPDGRSAVRIEVRDAEGFRARIEHPFLSPPTGSAAHGGS